MFGVRQTGALKLLRASASSALKSAALRAKEIRESTAWHSRVQGILLKPSPGRVVPVPRTGWKSRGWRSPEKLVKRHSLVSLKIQIQDSGWRRQTTRSLTSFRVNPASIANSGRDRESTGR